MNNQATQKPSAPAKVLHESKNRIRVEFERTSSWKRFRSKYITFFFLRRVVVYLFRFVLLVGISFVVLYPFITKIAASFMSPEDFLSSMVRLIPKYPTLNTYRAITMELHYWKALFDTTILSLMCGLIQTFICTFVGYGMAKFKFRGRNLLFVLVIVTMVVPHQTVQLSLFMQFRNFDIYGLIGLISKLITGKALAINMTNTYWPLTILSLTGLAFKNGLYIFVMRQFFKGIPDELEEAAYVDGAGMMKTFFTIIIPLSVMMMVTVFMFSFSWQFTDVFYTELFFTKSGMWMLPDIVDIPQSLMGSTAATAAGTLYTTAIQNTAGLMIIIPLMIVFLIGQNFIVQGIERSGITG